MGGGGGGEGGLGLILSSQIKWEKGRISVNIIIICCIVYNLVWVNRSIGSYNIQTTPISLHNFTH